MTTNYTYNALGQRIRKASSAGTSVFIYDESGHLLGEYTSSGALIQENVWLGDIPVAALRPNAEGGVSVHYVHTDHLNTPRRISRPADNAILWRWHSDPYGEAPAHADPDGDGTPFMYHLRFPGQYYDSETGLHYNYFRDYDPAVGRYVQSDPIGLEGGVNTFAYVFNNPIAFIDPIGLQTGCIWVPHESGWRMVPGSRFMADSRFLGFFQLPGALGAAMGGLGLCRWQALFRWNETRTTRLEMWCPVFDETCGKPEFVGYQKTEHTFGEAPESREQSVWEKFSTQGYRSPGGGMVCGRPNVHRPAPF